MPRDLDEHDAEALLLDESPRDLRSDLVELGGAVRGLAEAHEARVADGVEERSLAVMLAAGLEESSGDEPVREGSVRSLDERSTPGGSGTLRRMSMKSAHDMQNQIRRLARLSSMSRMSPLFGYQLIMFEPMSRARLCWSWTAAARCATCMRIRLCSLSTAIHPPKAFTCVLRCQCHSMLAIH